MNKKQYFNGSIVIGDPSYFVKNDEDWELCSYGEELDKLGFTDYLIIEFPDDPQIVVNETGDIIGGICQDSGIVAVVYKNELAAYNPDYERAFFDKENRTVIENFEGDIDYKTVHVFSDGVEFEDTVVSGSGNVNFRSCYDDSL